MTLFVSVHFAITKGTGPATRSYHRDSGFLSREAQRGDTTGLSTDLLPWTLFKIKVSSIRFRSSGRRCDFSPVLSSEILPSFNFQRKFIIKVSSIRFLSSRSRCELPPFFFDFQRKFIHVRVYHLYKFWNIFRRRVRNFIGNFTTITLNGNSGNTWTVSELEDFLLLCFSKIRVFRVTKQAAIIFT